MPALCDDLLIADKHRADESAVADEASALSGELEAAAHKRDMIHEHEYRTMESAVQIFFDIRKLSVRRHAQKTHADIAGKIFISLPVPNHY